MVIYCRHTPSFSWNQKMEKYLLFQNSLADKEGNDNIYYATLKIKQ